MRKLNNIMKTENISIRVSTDLKQKIERLSEENGLTHSQIIRPLIEEKLKEPIITDLGEGRYYNSMSDHELVNSLRFTELIFWIYDKNLDPENREINPFYEHLINVINEVKQSRLFTQNLKDELSVIQTELRECLEDDFYRVFKFPQNENLYVALNIELHVIRYNSENEQLIPFNQ